MNDPGWDPTDQLTERFGDWVPRQRWFGGKGRQFTVVAHRLAPLPAAGMPAGRDSGASVAIWLAQVTYADTGETHLYQVPLSAYAEPVSVLEHALVGVVAHDGRPVYIYDALHDKYVTGRWLLGIRDQLTVGPLHFERVAADPEAVPVQEKSLVLTGEQSNTSLIFGDRVIMKVFRRLEPGLNPDIEVHQALTARGATNIAPLLGSLGADNLFPGVSPGVFPEVFPDVVPEQETTSLAMLQEFLTTATDGWELAKISVRDLLAEADLHAEEAGGDFAGEATRLGEATAAVHAELAEAFGVQEMSAVDLSERASAMLARLDVAVNAVPQLAPLVDGLQAAFTALSTVTPPVVAQRIHGDLHLGQCMRSAVRWVVLDFEGEPSKSLVLRRAFDSPLRDVAGMLRSFDYVARHQLVDVGSTPQTEYRSSEWAARNRDAYCNGYANVSGSDPRQQDVLLRAFEADKAVYEAVYEARNRPNWLAIPLASLGRIAEAALTAASHHHDG